MPMLQPFGVVYARIITTTHGTEVQRTHGRNLPQRVFVRSAKMPMIGSNAASQRRGQSRIAAAAPAERPNTSV